MKKGRTTLQFTVTVPTTSEATIQSWLAAHGFELIAKNDEQFYRSREAVSDTDCCFTYQINGNQVTITAWLHGIIGGDISLETKNIFALQINAYRSLISDLIDAAKAPNQQNLNATQPQGTNLVSNPNIQNFQNTTSRRDETLCIIGFVMSIVGLLISLSEESATIGLIVYIVIYAFAARGLKTKKHGLAITTIIITTFSIILTLIKFINYLK